MKRQEFLFEPQVRWEILQIFLENKEMVSCNEAYDFCGELMCKWGSFPRERKTSDDQAMVRRALNDLCDLRALELLDASADEVPDMSETRSQYRRGALYTTVYDAVAKKLIEEFQMEVHHLDAEDPDEEPIKSISYASDECPALIISEGAYEKLIEYLDAHVDMLEK